MVQTTADGVDFKERLIASVKKEVKQLMEEAVTKKYVHEESSSVTSLCAAVEACLSQGLRRRALGLFKTSSTTALLHKIAKTCAEAEHISKMVQEIESNDPNKRSSSSSDSFNRPPMLKKGSSNSMSTATATTSSTVTSSASASASISVSISASNSSMSLANMKYLWIRLALYEKRLTKIIEYLVSNAQSYYDRDSLVADPDYGSILSSLLVGPCALEFTRAKTADHYWTDPHADELVQRHRISCRRSSSTCSRPAIINFKRSLNTSSDDASSCSFKSIASASVAKDYVESLHQNAKATLLYGKNNVHVLPKDVAELMPGYLSLHQHIQTLTIKWTPNQLMNGYNEAEEEEIDKEAFWAYALNINVDEIVYVHCHQSRGEDSGGTVILVGQDGVQRPPIHFPEGGHMQQFLSCLETGLLPHGQLDPPLWSQRGIGKMFLWPKSMRRRILPSVMESVDETPIDYVFRIVSKSRHEEFAATHSILDFVRSTPRRAQLSSCSTTGSSDCSNKSLSIDQYPLESPLLQQHNQSTSIEMVCSTMRRQIISRAFYGWLAYCRHLSTVRTHLSGLVHGRITPEMKTDEEGLTKERWEQLNADGMLTNSTEFYRLIYFGGVQPELRKDVWPYLLGHYAFGTTQEERQKQDETCKHYYETTMSEWLAVDAIVQQREKEKTARAVAKLSSGSNSGNERTVRAADLEAGGELENEVFEDISDISDPGDLEFDDEQRQQQQQQQQSQEASSAVSATHLSVKPIPRAMKTSTDSGHVDEGLDELDEEEEEEEDEEEFAKKPEEKQQSADEAAALDSKAVFEKEPQPQQQQQQPSCSTSTASSYETVGGAPQPSESRGVLSPEFLSADDLQAQLPHDEDTVKLTQQAAVIITNASVDIASWERTTKTDGDNQMPPLTEQLESTGSAGNMDALQQPKSACASPASSNGGVYSSELLEQFGLNLHRIEKDVQRCDRNYWYFANENLDKLRNVISTYVWEHLDIGYMQGMCDLVAPLLVIFDDESLSYSCFCKLMERMIENFPSGGAMDMHFANMRSLIQILDSEMYDLMDSNGDYTHFYFCYRWFLLDFKRELIYDDVFATWEVIWAAKHIASGHFVLFLALALLETYRDIILSNSMDFTDVIKFFNEMAERHNAQAVLQLARSLVLQLQMIIENK
ncbi:small G protein signaling modulator 1 [Drosophila sulfurigaster albostrigata]|uniref:small G protein signaling modulator 1 n=1 Tax=Drosophila sulfurigaster albostrigata TaxID=89887 RepID=UPI002D21865D|nr:small G protein signaling modulator 1 [Drosophila sulfurigaster albostrigata]